MKFRTPTPLKSTDRQWGQRGDNTTYSSAIQARPSAFVARPELSGGDRTLGFAVAAAIRAARFPGGGDLFRCPYVRLRQSDLVSGAGNLAFMPLRESLVHNSTLPRKVARVIAAQRLESG